MGNPASRDIFSNKTGPNTGTGLDTLAKNQGAIREGVGMLPPKEVTILDGAISGFEEAALIVDTEGGAAADDLVIISPVISATENLHPGMLITLRAKDPARVVTVKNSVSPNGINTADGNDIVLSPGWELPLRLVGGRWYEVPGKKASTSTAGNVKLDALAADGSATAAPGGFGLGVETMPSVTDLNLAVKVGDYYFKDTALNAPLTQWGYLSVKSIGTNAKVQYVTSHDVVPQRFIRVRYSGVWGGWRPEPTGFAPTTTPTANAVPQAGADGDLWGLAKKDMSNLTEVGTTVIAQCAAPSSRTVVFSVPTNEGNLPPAPAAGEIIFSAVITTVPALVGLLGKVGQRAFGNAVGAYIAIHAHVQKGDLVNVIYSGVTNGAITFRYKDGAY